MFEYKMRNNRDTDTVFAKQLHFLMDVVKEQTEALKQATDYYGPDDDGMYTSEFLEISEECNGRIKQAMITFLAETVGWLTPFTQYVEAARQGGGASDGEDFILQTLFGR